MDEQGIQTFVAPTMREALNKVRDSLGADAVILHTRQSPARGMFHRRANSVEVIASPGVVNMIDRSREQTPPSRRAEVAPAEATSMATTIRRLQERVDALSGMPTDRPVDREPSSLEHHLSRLEMPAGLIRECVEVCRHDRLGSVDPSAPSVTACLVNYLANRIRTADLLDDSTRAIALVGGNGVGKTATIAKLTARILEVDRPVAIGSIDGYRIGASEEIRRYARILGVPWFLAKSPSELDEFLNRQPAENVVLIDTPGRSPADGVGIDEVGRWLPTSVRRVLVVAANERDSAIKAAIDAFSVLDYERLILTKLDETPGTGAIAGVASQSPVPLCHVTMGQEVRDDLEEADPHRLAKWSLGEATRPPAEQTVIIA